MPSARVQFHGSAFFRSPHVVLGDGWVTYQAPVKIDGRTAWHTRQGASVELIEWDDCPLPAQDETDEIDFIRQFIANLSPDELEAGIEAAIGVGGADRMGEWIKMVLLGMVEG